MVFSSLIFLFVFLPLFLGSYFLVCKAPIVVRNFVILIFSAIFYLWGESVSYYILIYTTLVSYIGGILIGNAKSQSLKKVLLFILIGLSLCSLGWYKYAGFFTDNLNVVLAYIGMSKIELLVHPIMPIGISFYTFHVISYLIDIYRGKALYTKNLINYATYITMFPQLVAGPIIRYSTIEKQIINRTSNYKKFASGARRFLIGLFKKVLVANILAEPVDKIFLLNATEQSTALMWIAMISYSLQIYFDFSAYSDMAIGLGRMMGFRILENFNRPYLALSIQEFWRRWHISLSSWFRDYVYIPLGGNRVSSLRMSLNLFIVFFLCGFWHGANWTFIFWGIYHGTFLTLERIYGKYLEAYPVCLRRIYVALVVIISWTFFRADSFANATHYLDLMFYSFNFTSIRVISEFYPPVTMFIFCIALMIAYKIPQNIIRTIYIRSARRNMKIYVEALDILINVCLFFLTYSLLLAGSYNPFIYFRF